MDYGKINLYTVVKIIDPWSTIFLIFDYNSRFSIRIPCSKPLGSSKVNSAFHPSNFNQTAKNSWGLKSKLSPCGDTVVLRKLNPIYS